MSAGEIDMQNFVN